MALCLSSIALLSVVAVNGGDILLGDLNDDGVLSAADARRCLRTSAGLEELTDRQKAAADVFGNGEITAANARKILRVSAKLDSFTGEEAMDTVLKVGESFTLPPLKNAGSGMYNWYYRVTPEDGIEVTYEFHEPEYNPLREGTPVEYTYTFIAKKPGVYTVDLWLIASWETESIDEISFTIIVTE
jgi:predicted secreted protein